MMDKPDDGPIYSIAIDTGGTFTDLILADQHSVLGLYKAPTTYPDLFPGIAEALEIAATENGTDVPQLLERTSAFVYSTTHSTNAILEGDTARTALITTRGHRDVLVYREGGKDQMNNWAIPYPEPYVPRRLTFEVSERILSDGTVALPIDQGELQHVMQRLDELEVEAVGICLLWSVVNPQHELEVARALKELLPDIEYSLSHQVNRIIREYRRASATVIDASLKPLMRRHLSDMTLHLRDLGFDGEPLMVSHTSGAVLNLDHIAERPLLTVDAGPALSPIAGIVLDAAEPDVDYEDVLVVDTGGTSFDVSLAVDRRVAFTREKWIGPRWYGYMTGLPAVDTKSIGAGGGSIAWVDGGGLLHVGPESAGAIPGPVAYGRGGSEPTVTDAALVLGYLDPLNFLGGRMELDYDAARAALAERLGKPLGLTAAEAAEAMMAVASEEMRGLINDMTVAQGRDARRCLMIAGGGAAGLNIVQIAREAGMRHVLVPKLAAGLSALGGQFSDIAMLFSRTHHTVSADFDFEGVNAILAELDRDLDEFFNEVPHAGHHAKRFHCEARYDQQMWEIDVDLGQSSSFAGPSDVSALQADFDAKHLSLFAINQPGEPIEVLTWRGEARVVRPKPALANGANEKEPGPRGEEPATVRSARFSGVTVDTSVFSGASLAAGTSIDGPAVIEEPTTTIVVPPTASVLVRASHYLIQTGAPGD
jgi:N-methylhydantoinase A